MKQKNLVTLQGEVRPENAKRTTTRLYFKHAAALFQSFDSWKDNSKYYYIELGLNMAYCIGGMAVRIAEPPYHLGTIIRGSLGNPELFSYPCPECGERVYAYSYNGSPLSGRFDLSGACPSCGWRGYVTLSGWRVRSEALKAVRKEDRGRLRRYRFMHPSFIPGPIEDLLRSIGIPEDELVLPPEKVKETRTRLPNGDTLVSRSDGGFVIIKGED